MHSIPLLSVYWPVLGKAALLAGRLDRLAGAFPTPPLAFLICILITAAERQSAGSLETKRQIRVIRRKRSLSVPDAYERIRESYDLGNKRLCVREGMGYNAPPGRLRVGTYTFHRLGSGTLHGLFYLHTQKFIVKDRYRVCANTAECI